MRLNHDLVPQLEHLVECLNEWQGSLVEVVEEITRLPGTLDRHFTTRSAFIMRLEFVGFALSGSSLMVMGKAFERDVGYQATFDRCSQISVAPNLLLFVEQFSNEAERHTTFKLLGDK